MIDSTFQVHEKTAPILAFACDHSIQSSISHACRKPEAAIPLAWHPAVEPGCAHGEALANISGAIERDVEVQREAGALSATASRPFDDGDGGFLASLDFCADGIDETVNRTSERVAAAAGWESD